MNVSMAECNISATHVNASTIEYNLALSTLESTDPNGSFTDDSHVLQPRFSSDLSISARI